MEQQPAKRVEPLVATPPVVRFSAVKTADAEVRFRAYLDRQRRSLFSKRINQIEDLAMLPDGRVHGYRFNSWAFQFVVHKLARGAWPFMQDLLGLRPSKGENSPAAVRSIFTELVRLRFANLRGCDLICDRSTMTVEGLAGRNYRLMPHYELLDRWEAFLQEQKFPLVFEEAYLEGRRLRLCFRTKEPLWSIRIGEAQFEPIYGGCCLYNSEVGDCSLKSTSILMRSFNRTWVAAESVSDRCLRHVKGKNFDKRFARWIEKLQESLVELYDLQACVQSLADRRLDLGSTPESHAKRMRWLTDKMRRTGLRQTTASRVAAVTAWSGAFGPLAAEPPADFEDILRVTSQRTYYDLFCVLLFRCRQPSWYVVDPAERLAKKLLYHYRDLEANK